MKEEILDLLGWKEITTATLSVGAVILNMNWPFMVFVFLGMMTGLVVLFVRYRVEIVLWLADWKGERMRRRWYAQHR